MSATSFTLIVATRNRVSELHRLLNSLVAQTHRSFDVILVDQNADERVIPLVELYSGRLSIRHVRCLPRGLSAARNVGLQICTGEIIAFPDDDCWYPPDLLERVHSMLANHPEWTAVTGREASSAAIVDSPRFDTSAGLISRQNIWRRHISFTAFMRRSSLDGMFYDTSLGVGAGTIWGSGEETDFLLRFIERGGCAQYQPDLVVFHPDWGQGPYNFAAMGKARRYGMGMGRILQIHHFPLSKISVILARPLVGGFYTLLIGRPRKALYHWSIFAGRISGWLISLFLTIFHGPREAPQADSRVSLT